MKTIGIMGGTFDPIHYGHIVTAEKIKAAFDIDEIVFVPSGKPPHKADCEITPGHHRLAMVKLAVAGKPGFSVSTMELDRTGYSYALDTVDEFYRLYGNDIRLYFITGADAIKKITDWFKADELMEKCEFIAATRPGYSLYEDNDLPLKYKARIHLFPHTNVAVSSSDIRSKIAADHSIKEMMPPKVESYIREQRLYVKT